MKKIMYGFQLLLPQSELRTNSISHKICHNFTFDAFLNRFLKFNDLGTYEKRKYLLSQCVLGWSMILMD